MKRLHWAASAAAVAASVAALTFATLTTSPRPAAADDCPNGGTVRFGIEPYDTAARLTPIYEKVGKLISDKIGCKVEIYVADWLQRRNRSDAKR